MMRIYAYLGEDEETTLRLFIRVRFSYLGFTEEELYFMTKEAVDFVCEFRDSMVRIKRPTFVYDKRIWLLRYGTRKRRY